MSKPVRTENFVFMVFQVYIYIYISHQFSSQKWGDILSGTVVLDEYTIWTAIWSFPQSAWSACSRVSVTSGQIRPCLPRRPWRHHDGTLFSAPRDTHQARHTSGAHGSQGGISSDLTPIPSSVSWNRAVTLEKKRLSYNIWVTWVNSNMIKYE